MASDHVAGALAHRPADHPARPSPIFSLLRCCTSCAPWLATVPPVSWLVANNSHLYLTKQQHSTSTSSIDGADAAAAEANGGDLVSPLRSSRQGSLMADGSVGGTQEPRDGELARIDDQMTLWRKKSLRGLFSIIDHSPLGEYIVEQQLKDAVRQGIVETSVSVLRENDLGGYTIPASGLYPFQWNWDSAIVASGWAVFDEGRAWQEIESLFSGQWEDGMVPSIIFHKPTDSYFPGPEIWGTKEKPGRTTGISQPPVAAMSVRFLYEHAENVQLAQEKLEVLFPKLLAWHRWWYKARDPEGRGVVAILHPWESGMDNSPAWDEPMKFPVDDIPPYVRKDLTHVDAAMRPSKDTYDHYLTLLYKFKETNYYDSNQLYFVSPFRVTDLCVNCILYRANRDLRWLARQLGRQEVALEIEGWLDMGYEGFKTLWDDKDGIFKCQDQITGKLCDARTSAGFLPLFAGMASMEQARRLADTMSKWLDRVKYGVPSFDPTDPRFEPLRYWRGPVWIIINWMISNGLKHYGFKELAERIRTHSVELTSTAGLKEYFDPVTGAGAGGDRFSWTAAMCLAWLDRPAASAIGHKMNGPKRHLVVNGQAAPNSDSDLALPMRAGGANVGSQ